MLLHVSTPNVSSSGSFLCYLAKLQKYNCSKRTVGHSGCYFYLVSVTSPFQL